MNCLHCESEHCVKNGKSRHGNQRWICHGCRKTFGERDHRRIPETIKSQVMNTYLEGVGFRGLARLFKVSHTVIQQWVKKRASGLRLPPVNAQELEWIECDELCTFVGQKKIFHGSGGLLIVLPNESVHSRWAIVVPEQPITFLRNFLAENISRSVQTSGNPMKRSSKANAIDKGKAIPLPSRATT